jgi:hypothetical protein
MMPFLVDVDEVLLDWTSGFQNFMEPLGHKRSEAGHNTWRLEDAYPGFEGDPQEMKKLVEAFNGSTHFGFLLPVTGAASGLRRLREEFPESAIVGVSSCGDSAVTLSIRKANLNRFFPGLLDTIICLPLGGDKTRLFRSFRPGVVIDDGIHNLKAAEATGHRAIAFDRPWNKEWNGGYMDGWYDVDRLVSLKEYA